MQLHDLMARLDLAVIRLQFYGSIRMELYEALSLLLENRVLLRSEEHTSELQSRLHLVCRLLLEKKKQNTNTKKQKTKQNNTKQTH